MEKKLLYASLGKQIRELRENRRMSQEDLSRFLPLSRSSVVNIEKGKHRIQLHILFLIASTLEAPVFLRIGEVVILNTQVD